MKYLFIINLVFLCFACQPSQQEKQNNSVQEVTIPSDFTEFYDRFHANSSFQLSRIVFPLEGLPANADSLDYELGQFRWQKEDWQIHKALDINDEEFHRELMPLGDYTIIENITHIKQGFSMQRRFYKQSDGWYLIYYAGMNRTDK